MRTDGQTDITKLIVAFRSFANTPKSGIDCRNYIYQLLCKGIVHAELLKAIGQLQTLHCKNIQRAGWFGWEGLFKLHVSRSFWRNCHLSGQQIILIWILYYINSFHSCHFFKANPNIPPPSPQSKPRSPKLSLSMIFSQKKPVCISHPMSVTCRFHWERILCTEMYLRILSTFSSFTT
jgi:hypothetical protein